MNGRSRIELLGGLRVYQDDRVVDRFRTQKAAALLAYLACHLREDHPREVLTEMLWPETEPRVGRARLRQALSSLRLQLEPPGVPAGAVIRITRFAVRLNPSAVETDVSEFEQSIHAAARASAPSEQVDALTRAVELYRGDLLPGHYDDWVLREQRRLSVLFLAAAHRLVGLLEESGEVEQAIGCAVRAVNADPLSEAAHADLIRLYVADGQTAAAGAQYEELRRLLRDELGREPAPATRRLIAGLAHSAPAASRNHLGVSKGQAAGKPDTSRSATVSQNGRPHLPVQATRFFGREGDIEALLELLGSTDRGPSDPAARLVTLTGAGGIGKTRLAIQAAGRLAGLYAGAAWFVPLAGLSDPGLIPGAIIGALGIRDAGSEPLDLAINFLSRQPSLLVLDNMEHLLGVENRESRVESRDPDGAEVVRRLLGSVPGLALVVTSRRVVGLTGEREFPVVPLPIPNDKATQRPDDLVRIDSVRLFVDRAQAVRPDFQVTVRNTATLAELCARLEGLPLAIELAAARARMMTPGQMLEQMENRFELLVSRRRDVESRHRSLQAAIEWSYCLLPADLRRLFCRLSVFRGGWTAEAAEVVCASGDAGLSGHTPILESLEYLRESSLILAKERDGAIRFDMLGSLREFGYLRLTAHEREDTRRRHAACFLEVAEPAPEDREREEREGCHWGLWDLKAGVLGEIDNVRAALAWYVDEGNDLPAGDRLVKAMATPWIVGGHWREGERRVAETLARNLDAPAELRGYMLGTASIFAFITGNYPAAWGRAEEALGIYRRLGDGIGISAALGGLAYLAIAWKADYPLARELTAESLKVARMVGNRKELERGLSHLELVAEFEGDPDLAAWVDRERTALGITTGDSTPGAETRLGWARALGDRPTVASCLDELSQQLFAQECYEEARCRREEAVALWQELGNRRSCVDALNDLGVICLCLGEHDNARRHLEAALAGARALGDRRLISIPLERLGELALRLGDCALARASLDESVALSREIGFAEGTARSLTALARVSLAKGDCAEARRLLFESLGIAVRARKGQWAVDSLGALARVSACCGEWNASARLLGCAAQLREDCGRPIAPHDRGEHEALLSELIATLGPESFAAAFAEGRATPWQTAATPYVHQSS